MAKEQKLSEQEKRRQSLIALVDKAKQLQSQENKPSVYEVLSSIDVLDFTDQKKGLTYLSWADALFIMRYLYPDFKYEQLYFDTYVESNGILYPQRSPYLYDTTLGYLVGCKITINEITLEETLPVYDTGFNPKKSSKYTRYKTDVDIANMGDVNYAHKRCLVKCLAGFGLGEALYRKESLPSGLYADTPEQEIEALKQAMALFPYDIAEVNKLREELINRNNHVKTMAKEIQQEINEKKSQVIFTEKMRSEWQNGIYKESYVEALIKMAEIISIDVDAFITKKPTNEVK